MTTLSDQALGDGDGIDSGLDGMPTLGREHGQTALTHLTTAAALSGLPQAAAATLTVPRGRSFITVSPTSPLAEAVDALQFEHGGPSVAAIVDRRDVVHVDDLRTESRWPTFSTTTLEQTPVLGIASFRLFVGQQEEDSLGCLTLYATAAGAFDAAAIAEGERLAAYAAVILAFAAEREKNLNLERALLSSRDIGAAVGVLMARRLVTREDAFQLLRTASQHANRKLREIAEDVLHTGDLPADPAPGSPQGGSRD